MEATVGKAIPMGDLIREADIKGVPEDTTIEVVEKLKGAGDIHSPEHGFVSWVVRRCPVSARFMIRKG